MKLPKIIIFDVGGTLIKGTWKDSILGYAYLYEEVLDFPFVEEYLDLLEEANNKLLDICFIMKKHKVLS